MTKSSRKNRRYRRGVYLVGEILHISCDSRAATAEPA